MKDELSKNVASQATPAKDLEDKVMNPNIPKSETEWWAKRKIEELKEKAEKWDKLKAHFDTSCDKCFLNHICGTHGNPGAVCEDIKDALEAGTIYHRRGQDVG